MLSIQPHVSLAPLSTFCLGGPADYLARVTTLSELVEALEYAKKNHLETLIIAGGSNVLIADHGVRGLVIHIANESMRVAGRTILADAGAMLLSVVNLATEQSLAGMEYLAGIPGSLGGAIRGNAGAFGMEIGQVVKRVKVYDRQRQLLREFSQKDCEFGYRTSFFKTHPELIIFSVELELKPGEREVLERINRSTMAEREAKHPQKARCAGSFFMNPTVENAALRREFEKDTGQPSKNGKLPAGWLIDHVGLRGKKIGGAMVSERHPNYIINVGGATTEQVIMLASLVKQRVRDELGVMLKEEVQLVGF